MSSGIWTPTGRLFSTKQLVRACCSVVFKRRMATLETLKFDNRALRSLPIDKEEQNYVRTVTGMTFSSMYVSISYAYSEQ